MVTRDPNPLTQPVHPTAILTILRPEDWKRWLTCGYNDLVTLQRPYLADLMTARGPALATRDLKAFPL